MKVYACTEERLLQDVSKHQMLILRDEGVNRHIRFKKPGTNAYYFDLITWPGSLCIDGDCGTYVFRRTEDMFDFFRTDKRDFNFNPNGLSINPSYWGEKLTSIGKNAGYMEFSREMFHKSVKDRFDSWVSYNEADEEISQNLWEELKNQVLSEDSDGQDNAIRAAIDFSFRENDFFFSLADFWEERLEDFTHSYIWCCYGIAWGITQYDNQHAAGMKNDAQLEISI